MLILIVAFGALLRLYHLDEESIWLDEAVSIQASSASPMTIIQRTAVQESYPPLYYLLLHFWMEMFGSGVVAVRALSVLFGVAALPLIYLLGRALYGQWVGLISAFLLAVSPFHIYYSQEARMYALFALLSLASAYALMNLLVQKKRLHFVAYVLFTALCLYTYYYSYFLLLFENLFVLWIILRERQNRVSWKGWGLAQALVFGLYMPWFWVALSQDTTGIDWIPSTPGTPEALWKYLSLTFYRFLYVDGSITIYAIKVNAAALRRALSLVGLLAVLNLVSIKVGEDNSTGVAPENKVLFVLGYLFLIPVMAFLVSAFVRPIYLTRALILCVPPLCLMGANGAVTGAKAMAKLARFPSLLAKAAVPVVSLLLLVVGTYWWDLSTRSLNNIYTIVQKEQWREAVERSSGFHRTARPTRRPHCHYSRLCSDTI